MQSLADRMPIVDTDSHVSEPPDLWTSRLAERWRPLMVEFSLFEPYMLTNCAPPRLVADAIGVDAVIVNGEILRRDGQTVLDPAGPQPGAVLRS